eukprot:TRINITY_DN29627_c0_g1_i2.p1 TRINITY_DN29627_c0_g1~~TRINITY_DN29627_c0_g1_i2.p1  ORF type:complete len:119 (+),score=1.75 TRINITY_DN29627_c0_g1_i2:106-462(+)
MPRHGVVQLLHKFTNYEFRCNVLCTCKGVHRRTLISMNMSATSGSTPQARLCELTKSLANAMAKQGGHVSRAGGQAGLYRAIREFDRLPAKQLFHSDAWSGSTQMKYEWRVKTKTAVM